MIDLKVQVSQTGRLAKDQTLPRLQKGHGVQLQPGLDTNRDSLYLRNGACHRCPTSETRATRSRWGESTLRETECASIGQAPFQQTRPQ